MVYLIKHLYSVCTLRMENFFLQADLFLSHLYACARTPRKAMSIRGAKLFSLEISSKKLLLVRIVGVYFNFYLIIVFCHPWVNPCMIESLPCSFSWLCPSLPKKNSDLPCQRSKVLEKRQISGVKKRGEWKEREEEEGPKGHIKSWELFPEDTCQLFHFLEKRKKNKRTENISF